MRERLRELPGWGVATGISTAGEHHGNRNMKLPQLDEVELAVAKLAERCNSVTDELVPIEQALGRVLSLPLTADRNSPATDVSAMDGYAVRVADLQALVSSNARIQIGGVACAGRPPLRLEAGKAVQIFTGGCIPTNADCVIRREDTLESAGEFELRIPLASLSVGQNIRRRGENTTAGQVVLAAGTEITTATIGTLASFGRPMISVRRVLRVSILTSGDELIEPGESVQEWQIRDSNGPTLRSWLSRLRWATLVHLARVKDDLASTRQALQSALDVSDVVIVTGGVSSGDTDFIPKAIVELGGEVVFHRLPIRPGKPVLGAYCQDKIIFGLPGNPVSTSVTARVIAQPVLERLVGRLTRGNLYLPLVDPDENRLSLIWYRLIRLDGDGCRLVDSRGSGDFVSMAQSDGFIKVPAGLKGSGPWPAWLW
jgi:molybdopterin molybdotransferase